MASTEEKKNPESKAVATQQPSASVRFMNKVMAEFGDNVGDIALTNFQKRLAQNYFIAIDAALSVAEEKRRKKSEKYRDPVPVTWNNVDLALLARSVVAKARIGLDPAQKNHVSMVPFKNNTSGKYDIVFIDGYRGIELTAKKYGQDVPDAVIVELVYTHDKFKSIKKSADNQVERYEFEIVDDFDRGEIRGGFYYHAYKDNPEKNKLVVMTLKDILKRKPTYASVEFWGGEKDVWKNGKKAGTEKVEGWYEKMCWKTVYRAAYGDITIDSQKIDNDYLQLKQLEASYAETEVMEEIEESANTEDLDIDYDYDVDPETGEIIEDSLDEDKEQEQPDTQGEDAVQEDPEPTPDDGEQMAIPGTETKAEPKEKKSSKSKTKDPF